MKKQVFAFTYSVWWNLLLLVFGATLWAWAFKAIVIPHKLFTGGVAGLSLLLSYWVGGLPAGTWYFLINVPIFLMAWLLVSRRFFLYSLFGMVCLSALVDLVPWTFPVHSPGLAVLAAGSIMGAGGGIALRSLGSLGGTDVFAIILAKRYDFRPGQVGFAFNLLVFGLGLALYDVDQVLYSLAMVFLSAWVMEYFLGMFNKRRMVLIISDKPEEIAQKILHEMRRGCTFLHGRGAYTGKDREVIMTVVNGIQVKRLEELVFTTDPQAFTIIDSTLNVLGEGFSARKKY
ncbi:Protein of unknown function DUF2179 [Desulfovibrio sp. X2]|uniref:YitT family protein n=1 Tax=Desulfovibrio sp. X2 TaxID=941449 RepID=UPI000358A99D|nr:YitT family protein [Desulfovibrio sp. X2]EPR43928.1 Protein of unknown function DUF2179 [Desulfovibrio sp. X2]